jgi:hypothetical protein
VVAVACVPAVGVVTTPVTVGMAAGSAPPQADKNKAAVSVATAARVCQPGWCRKVSFMSIRTPFGRRTSHPVKIKFYETRSSKNQ